MLRICIAAILVLAAMPPQSLANAFVYTSIADFDTQMPDASIGVKFMEFGVPAIEVGTVAFVGCQFSGQACVNGGQQGVYRFNGQSISFVANRDTEIPLAQAGGLSFQDFGPVVIAGDNVAFWGGNRRSSANGIFSASGSNIHSIVNTFDPIAGGNGTYWNFPTYSTTAGSLAFSGTDGVFGTQRGVFTNVAGSLSVIADTNTAIPNGVGNFVELAGSGGGGEYQLGYDGTTFAFTGQGANGQTGIYASTDGAPMVVADTSTPIPGNLTQSFRGFQSLDIAQGNVAFVGSGAGNDTDGVYTNIGGALNLVANTSTTIGNTNLRHFDVVAIDQGRVAFEAIAGVYSNLGGTLQKVLGPGDVLGGKSVSSVALGQNGFSGNRIALNVSFHDFTQALFVASVDAEGTLSAPTRFSPPPDSLIPCASAVSSCFTALTAGSPATLSQSINVPDTATSLGFDYGFLTGSGALSVFVNDQVLATYNSDGPDHGLAHVSLSLGDQFIDQRVALTFFMDGPAGSTVLLDNIIFPSLINGDFATGDLTGWIGSSSAEGFVGAVALAPSNVPIPNSFSLLAGCLTGFLLRKDKRSGK